MGPPSLADVRAPVWIAVCLAAASLTAGVGAYRLTTDAPARALVELASVVLMLIAARDLAWTGDLRRSVAYFVAGSSVALSAALLVGDPLGVVGFAWHGMLPLFTAVAVGRRSSLGRWTMPVRALPFVVVFFASLGLPGSRSLDPSHALTLGILFAGLGAMTWSYESVQAQSDRQLATFRRSITELTERTDDLIHSRNQFVKNVSHEFRTPLNHILGATQLLATTPLDEEQRELVSLAEGSGRELLGLIDDAISVHDLEQGGGELKVGSVDLKAILRNIQDTYRPRADAKRLGFSITLEEGLGGERTGDAAALERVICNLLDNALAFTDRGRVEIGVYDIRPGRLAVDVSDTGIGIPPELQERIFEPFRQGDESDTRRHGGLGTGLAVCRRTARLMGGEVSVRSAPGEGSRFRLEVPLPTGKPAAPSARSRVERALLYEPNPRVRAAFVSTLQKSGIPEVSGVASPEEMMMALDGPSFDLIFADPTVADHPTARHRLEQERGGGTFVVALTPSDTSDLALPMSFDDRIPKPLRREQILEMVRQWADRPYIAKAS